MLKKFKIFSAPILLGAIFLLVAGAVFYFHNLAHAVVTTTGVALRVNSVSFALDSSNPQLVHYKATVESTGLSSSDKDMYTGGKTERKVYFTVSETIVCSVIVPVIQNGEIVTVECASDYVPAFASQLKVGVNDKYTSPFTIYSTIVSMFPDFKLSFTQVPPYYNLNDKLNPAQIFTVNVKNTGFPLRNDIVDGFSFFHRGGYSCKTTVLFDQVNSPTGQNVSCAITPTITSSQISYDVTFSSSNPYATISQTIRTGAPDLTVSEIYCGERLNSGSSIACSISIKNNSLPIAQNSLTRGLVVKASFFDSTRKIIGTSNKEVCSFDFSNADISTLNVSGGILAKQCVIPSTDIPVGAMFVDTTATIDPQNIIKETSEGNNTSMAKEVSFQGQDATQVVNIIVKIDPSSVSAAGIKILFQDADGFLQATCFGSACSVNLPSGEYQALTNSIFVSCLAPDCPLKFQVDDRAVNLELKVKSTTPPTTNFCSDSDANEANPYLTQGAVRFYSKNSQVFSGMTDSCVSGKLREYSCSTSTYNSIDFSCPNGCYKGACVQKCATLFGSADLQCKSLGEMETFKQQCSNKEVIYDELRVGQYCSQTGGSYCVQCKPECENDADCHTRQCPIAGEESYCSIQKCACRKSLPDLTVTTAFICPKSLYSVREPISGCSITIKNIGNVAATNPATGLRYKTANSSWTPLTPKVYSGALGQNMSTPIIFDSFNFPNVGTFEIQACVDYKTNEITESNEDNNCSAILPIEVKASPVESLPDLTVGALTCPKNSYNTGDSISGCSITIKNQGAAVAGTATNRPTTILRYRTAKSAWTILDTKTSASALAIAGTEKINFKDLKFDTAGSYLFQACVDDSSQITESNEDNNCSDILSIGVKTPPITPQPVATTTPPATTTPTITKCIDSDNGKNIFSMGTTTGLGDDAKMGVFNDYCDPKDANMLYEYYCFDTTAAKEQQKCNYGCEKGACKKLPPIISLPDLTITSAFSCPKSSYDTGETISGCSVTIKNQGTNDTTVKPVIGLRYRTANTSWITRNTITSPDILRKDSSKIITFDSFVFNREGDYIIQACVDPDPSQIVESNENNNCSAEVSIEVRTLPIIPPVATSTPPITTTTPPITTTTSPVATTTLSQWIDCKVKYNPAYWCSSYVDWTKECNGRADPNAIKQEIPCNGNNGDYCVTCASTPKPPTVCSDCGKGIFNTCDIKECQNLGKDCVFSDGKCFIQNAREIIIPLPSDKETKMTIPAGTFLVSVTPTVSAISPNSVDASGLSSLGTPLKFVDFSIKDTAGNEIHNFGDEQRKITIQVSYADQKISKTDEDSLRLYIFNGTIWEPLDTTVHKDTKTLTAQTTHFTVVAAAADYRAGNFACLPCCQDTDCNITAIPPVKIFECVGSDKASGKCTGSKDSPTFDGTYGECQLIGKPVTCSLTKYNDFDSLINEIIKWIFYLALIIAPLMILLGGFYMLTAAGEPARSTQGKTIITWALVGLAVILAAKAFISIITSVLK